MNLKRENSSKKAQYISSLFASEDNILQSVRDSIANNNLPPINITAAEARLVQLLLKLHQSETVIEIGTLAGYSAIWLARALPRNGRLFTFEKDKKNAEIAAMNISNSDVADKIKIIAGDAHENLKSLESIGPFDAIFIDAEKSGYCRYLDWAEKHIRKGGLIIGDNTFLFGHVFEEAETDKSARIMKEFNRRLSDSSKYDGIIIPTDEGLTVAIKKF